MPWQIETRYLATVTNQPFLLPETRHMARWHLDGHTPQEMRTAVTDDNVLQIKARSTRLNVYQALAHRLQGAPVALFELLAEHSLEVARLSNFYVCLRQYRLLRELMAERICDNASRYVWSLTGFEAEQFFAHKREQQPALAAWSEHTYRRVMTNTLRLAHDAGLLQGRGPWSIHRPLLPPALRQLMLAEGDGPYLRYFLEVSHVC